MADQKFLGKWKSDTMENFDDYMKALGLYSFYQTKNKQQVITLKLDLLKSAFWVILRNFVWPFKPISLFWYFRKYYTRF